MGGESDFVREARTRQKWMGAVRARIGYDAGRWMPYVAGGVAYGKVKESLHGVNYRHPLTIRYSFEGNKILEEYSYGENKIRVGWTAGAGVDYAMTDNAVLRLEYRYTDLGNKTYHTGEYIDYRAKYKSNDFRVGVAYKF